MNKKDRERWTRFRLEVEDTIQSYMIPADGDWEGLLREFNFKLDWWHICAYGLPLSEDFIREFEDKLDWDILSRRISNEKIIEEFKDKVNWTNLYLGSKLSEKLIEKYKDRIDWNEVEDHRRESLKKSLYYFISNL